MQSTPFIYADILALGQNVCETEASGYWLRCAGTPEGIGPVKPGQKITAGITGLVDVHFDAERRSTPVTN